MQTDLLIFSGQSNMQGQTGAFPDPNEPVENAWEYRLKDDACIPLRHPCGEDVGELLLGADRGQGSLVPAFCRAYVQGTRNRVIAVHAAKGATTIAEWQEGGPRFAKLVEKINGARRRQSAACETPGKVYLIWLQGESDALAGTSAAEYESALERFRRSLNRAVGLDAFFLIRVAKFACDGRDLPILQAQERLCRSGEFILLTRMAGRLQQSERYLNPQAANHFNNAGMELLGRVAGENAAKFAAGTGFDPGEEPYLEMKKDSHGESG